MRASNGDASLSRRAFVMAAGSAALAAMLGAQGCEYDANDPLGIKPDTGIGTGFASDAADPMGEKITLVMWTDSYVKKLKKGDGTYLDSFMERYHLNQSRGNVTLDVRYKETSELAKMAVSGFDEGDILLCDSDTMDAALEAGTAYGGTAELSVRDYGYQFPSSIFLCKKKGSKLSMPKADTYNGEDASDGSSTRIMNLAKIKGTIAIAGAGTFSGKAARQCLKRAQVDFQDEEGAFVNGFEDVFVSYDTDDAAAKALQRGDVDAAFILSWDKYRMHGLDVLWEYSSVTPDFKGASITISERGGVARDLLEFIANCS